jgi:nanoRNase/pAp phosphatase (c-di-AMP/oligoRNAs hydrolase)
VGHSIFNPSCNVNVGLMLSEFEGGGHRGAGACKIHVSKAEDYLQRIIGILLKNKPNEN